MKKEQNKIQIKDGPSYWFTPDKYFKKYGEDKAQNYIKNIRLEHNKKRVWKKLKDSKNFKTYIPAIRRFINWWVDKYPNYQDLKKRLAKKQ